MDKVWALRSSVTIPLAHVRSVDVRPKDAHVRNMKGLRVGSYIPGHVLAGYFYMFDGVGVNAAAVFESLEQAHKAIEAWPEGSGTPREASHRNKALEHLGHATEEMRGAAKEMGIDPADKGRGWAFYEVHDPEKTIGIDVDGEKVRRVVIEIEGQTPEAAAQAIDEAARRKR
jgi:hypothetical protein